MSPGGAFDRTMDEKDLLYKGLKDLAARCLEEGRPRAYLLIVKELCRNEAEERYAWEAFRAALKERDKRVTHYMPVRET